MEMCTKASRIFVVDNWYGLAAVLPTDGSVRFNCRPEMITQPKLAKKNGVASGVMLVRMSSL